MAERPAGEPGFLSIVTWLKSRPIQDWSSFEVYGDTPSGDVWFTYVGQHSWPHSCYDTRSMALAGDAAALEHMTNYYHAIVAWQLKGAL